MTTNPTSPEVTAILTNTFPIETEALSLELCVDEGSSPVVVDGDSLRATIRLIVWDLDGDTRMLRDIKEQQVLVCDQRVHELTERLAAGLQAHARVLRAVFEDSSRDVESWMPSDLLFPAVFRLKSARTVEDFTRALAVKSRLDVPALRG